MCSIAGVGVMCCSSGGEKGKGQLSVLKGIDNGVLSDLPLAGFCHSLF